MTPLRISILGLGWIARHGYLPALSLLPEIEVVAAFDIANACVDSVASHLGLPLRCFSMEACLAPAVDAVLICTPPFAHPHEIAECVSRGKFVLCEKPMLRSPEELEMAGPAAMLRRRVMGSATMRLRPEVTLLLSWIREGRLGALQRVSLQWKRARGVPGAGSWRTDLRLSPLGVMEDLGPHLLDILAAISSTAGWGGVRLMDAQLACAYGHRPLSAAWFSNGENSPYEVPDQARAHFRADDEVEIDLSTCWASDCSGDHCSLRLEGSDGTARFEGLFGFSPLRKSDEQFCALECRGEEVERQEFAVGPGPQHEAFGRSLALFRDFYEGRSVAVANYDEVAQVAQWMSDIRAVAMNVSSVGLEVQQRACSSSLRLEESFS